MLCCSPMARRKKCTVGHRCCSVPGRAIMQVAAPLPHMSEHSWAWMLSGGPWSRTPPTRLFKRGFLWGQKRSMAPHGPANTIPLVFFGFLPADLATCMRLATKSHRTAGVWCGSYPGNSEPS